MLKRAIRWLWLKAWGPPAETAKIKEPADPQRRHVEVSIDRHGARITFRGYYCDLLDLLDELSGEAWRRRDGFFNPKGNDDDPEGNG